MQFSSCIKSFVVLCCLCWLSPSYAQEIKLGDDSYSLTVKKMVAATPVKDQGRTGTCWSFATSSFIESEALRQNKGEHDVSEMFFVRHNYPDKAKHYVRMHGHANFGQGSLSHDVTRITAEHGIVPEAVYRGLNYGSAEHNHSEMFGLLKSMVDALVDTKGKLSNNWMDAFEGVLNAYLGEVPEEFEYKGAKYDPKTFASDVLGFDPANYVQLTSFEHHPFYEEAVLEIPDNWANGQYYNIPIDELENVMDYALNNGYSIAWDGDVSEKTFSHGNGLAIVPEKDWAEMSAMERETLFKRHQPEKAITQEMRQETFDNYETTDDHLMHIIGTVTDENGAKYYVTKNSWGDDSNGLGGYLYLSRSYNRLKCVAIMLHKDALPKSLIGKLKI